MSIGQRISGLMLDMDLSNARLARMIGVSRPTIGNWIEGKSAPTGENLTNLANTLKVDPNWLMTGKESNQHQSSIHFAPVEFRSADTKGRPGNVRIPIYRDVKASCGSGIENFLEDASDYLEIDPVLLKLMGVEINPKNLKIIYAAEYSMYPTVAPESPLFVDVSDKDPNSLKNGNVYVFTHNHELRMKRIFVSYGSQAVKLTSDNPDKNRYPDEFISNEQLNEINFVGRLELALVKP